MGSNEKQEIEFINNIIISEIQNSNLDLAKIELNLVIGKYEISKPGTVGCFKEDDKWYVYDTDDRMNLHVNGPVSLQTVIAVCVRSLPLDLETKKSISMTGRIFQL